MNCRYRQKDYATDVLSFSYRGVKLDGFLFLGEIVIAPGVALDHAIRYGVQPERELRRLLVHGVLHLLGYDHETDQGQMNRLQTKLLRRRFILNSPSLADFRANP
jgi:probable rRNA maturation factor